MVEGWGNNNGRGIKKNERRNNVGEAREVAMEERRIDVRREMWWRYKIMVEKGNNGGQRKEWWKYEIIVEK